MRSSNKVPVLEAQLAEIYQVQSVIGQMNGVVRDLLFLAAARVTQKHLSQVNQRVAGGPLG